MRLSSLLNKVLFRLLQCNTVCLVAICSYGQTGIGTTSPNSSLHVNGALSYGVRSVTANTALTISDEVLLFKGTSSATVTLPDATQCTGRIYWIKNASSTLPVPVLTIQTIGSQMIDGVSSTSIDEPYEAIRLVSDGSSWNLFHESVPIRKTATAASVWYQGGNKLNSSRAVGTISNYDMAFMSNGQEGFRLNANGFMGINTVPTYRWHSANDNNDAGNNYILDDFGTTTGGFFMRKSRGTIGAGQDLQAGDLISQFRLSGRSNGSITNNSGSGVDAYYMGVGTNNLTDLRFSASNAEAMRLNPNGQAAIGSSTWDGTNPEKLLVDAGNTSSYNVISGRGSIDNYLQLNIQNRSGTANASSDIVATANNGNESTNFIDMGINSGFYSNASLPILTDADLAYVYSLGNDFVIGNGTAARDLVFFTNGYATSNERMRITSAGDVGIGTTTPGSKLTVAGIVSPVGDNLYSMGTSTNRWSEVWSTNGVIQTSDKRLKTNIRPLPYGLKELQSLHPIQYRWAAGNTGLNKIGLSAQETQKLIPEVVTGNAETETLGMNYAELVTLLINAIKEQEARLSALNKELKQLHKLYDK